MVNISEDLMSYLGVKEQSAAPLLDNQQMFLHQHFDGCVLTLAHSLLFTNDIF